MTSAHDHYPFVSVIVAALNEERRIGACLAGLAAQTYPLDRFEVIVADGGSIDRTREIVNGVIETGALSVRIVDNPDRSTAAGRNRGLAEAKGDVIIPLDAHTLPSSTFVASAVSALEWTGADCAGGPIRSASEGIIGRAIGLAMSSPFGVGNAAFRYANDEQWTDTVAFGAYRRSVFDRVGQYDVTMERGEDDELNFRIIDSGGRIYLTPTVEVTYYTRSSFADLWRQYVGYGEAKVSVLRRHPARVRPRQLVPGAFVASIAVGALLAPRSRLVRRLLRAMLSTYALASLVATLTSLQRAARQGESPVTAFTSAPAVPVAFAVMHVAYGLGSWLGLLKSVLR